ncbi:MAG: TRAP transporter large permease [Desulfovibrio sp.]|jgi:C4-dicarboxylate transporter DctM subunit|nr:TRAP transporter large permease [Desulfovibrio sp.]
MDFPVICIAVTLIVLLLLGTPIGVSLCLGVIVGILASGLPPEFLMQKMLLSLDSFPLVAVIFFVLAGEIMQKGSMADALLRVSRCLVGHITGGMAHVSVLTCMFYGALSGSSPATVAAVGGIMIPAMEKEGYSKDFSAAVNTAAGCLGVMIPPSVPLIIYGTTANVSVGDLFIAGIMPGVFIGILLMLLSYFLAKRLRYKGGGKRASMRETLSSLNNAKYALCVPLIVLGGIYGGVTTPTEAGAVAVCYAFLIEGLVLRTLDWAKLKDIFRSAGITNAAIFLVVAAATALGQILMIHNVPDAVVHLLSGVSGNPYLLLFVIVILLLILGTFMDALANILILTPLLLPIIKTSGINLTHFGIIMIVGVSLGFLTPPVGVNLFVTCGISGLSIQRLSLAVLPFLGIMIIGLLVLAYVPFISLMLL